MLNLIIDEMDKSEKLKKTVKEKYAEIVRDQNKCCCGSKNEHAEYTVFNESYENQPGYVKEADLNLGCGVPTEYAGMKPGDLVLDLGSGAGNDCFVARSIVGEKGHVTGLDFTNEMVRKANANLLTLGYKNIDFVLGDIENIPLKDKTYDVVISNCVLNLVPDKVKAFKEIKRVLKSGGHFCVSDIVLKGELPDNIKEVAELYAGCVSGALQMEEYIGIIKDSGFTQVEIKKERQINVPDEMFLKHISQDDLKKYKSLGTGIYSITVVATKQ